MARTPFALAALATAAVPGLKVTAVAPAATSSTDCDCAVVVDSEHRQWLIRAPRDAAAGAALEAEAAFLTALAPLSGKDRLPFAVPQIAGHARLPEGGRATLERLMPGHTLELDELTPSNHSLAARVGATIAAIHNLPTHFVEDAGLPSYDAEAYRRRRLTEVKEAERTGYVPHALLARWMDALDSTQWWQFSTLVTHGDLTAEHVLTADGTVVGVSGWSETKVADPADDLAWLLITAPDDAWEAMLASYRDARAVEADDHLVDRAILAGELALVRWLLQGVRSGVTEVIEDAAAMLADLDDDLARAAEAERLDEEAREWARIEEERRLAELAEAKRVAAERAAADRREALRRHQGFGADGNATGPTSTDDQSASAQSTHPATSRSATSSPAASSTSGSTTGKRRPSAIPLDGNIPTTPSDDRTEALPKKED